MKPNASKVSRYLDLKRDLSVGFYIIERPKSHAKKERERASRR